MKSGEAQNYGTVRQEAAKKLYTTLINSAKEAANEIAQNVNKAGEEDNVSIIYIPNREITVYLAGKGEAAEQQPVVQVKEKEADIALRKFISKIENAKGTTNLTGANSRAPEVDTSNFNRVVNNEFQTTAIYNHPKNPVSVKKEDIVTYTIRLYNEGEVPAYIKQVTDYLPEYLMIDDTDERGYWEPKKVASDTAETEETIDESVFITTENCRIVNAGGLLDYDTIEDKLLINVEIPAAKKNENATSSKESYILSYVDIEIRCKVSKYTPMEVAQTNIAEVTMMTAGKDGNLLNDRDSQIGNVKIPSNERNPELEDYRPNYKSEEAETKKYVPGQQDDDDFDKVIIRKPAVDMALRKFINQIGETQYDREPNVDLSALEVGTTAIYNHSKEPISVKEKDIVTYTIRLYNEGDIDGYVTQVKDHIAKYLKYVPSEEEKKDGKWWTETEGAEYNTLISTDNCKVVNVGGRINEENIGKALKEVMIPAYDEVNGILSYVDIQVICEVQPVKVKTKITNIAEITKEAVKDTTTDEEGNVVESMIEIEKDRDSKPDNAKIPVHKDLPGYKDDEIGKPYVPGQQDDDDFEKLLIEPYFDLALRKFITAVGNTSVNNRYPEVSYTDGKFTYNHSKIPVPVKTGDIVTYTIRIFNEGQADGYANEITDDVPEGLEFVIDNEINKVYRWKMLDKDQKETTDVTKAKYIITDYLSEEQEKETKRDNKIDAFELDAAVSKTNPDYRDVKVAFKVTYVPKTKEDTQRTIINVAQISKDSDDDIDSIPNRDEIYDPNGDNEDDIDYDNVIVKYFDLALLKWVSQTKITIDGQTVITDTGHTAENARNEEPVKIELAAKDINKVVIKYIYTIRVTNEGELEGYATEIKDHIPQGLKFEEADNTEWRWKVTGDGIVTTDYLKDTLLKPNESAEVPIVLTWINNAENFGEKVNLAEISKDKNDGDVPDIDSTPDNLKPDRPYEDDEDDAPVILALKTGTIHIYIGLIGIILITFASGIGLIKKYVL